MKAHMLITAGGPIMILSSHESPADAVFVGKLRAKGIDKFMAYELPWEEVKERYGGHFQTVEGNLHETDDLRVLDYNGHRAFQLFKFKELGDPIIYE